MNVDRLAEDQKRGRIRRVVVWILLCSVLLGLVIVAASLVFFDRDAWIMAHKVSGALENPQRVVLVEYSGKVEIARKIATPQEVARLRGVLRAWPRIFVPEARPCFEPHHRIEIGRADGSEWNSAICFLCSRFAIEEEPFLAPLPPYLAKSLDAFFASVVKPKTDDEYRDIEMSGPRG